jgi:integral membrane sensor domain MASE1
MSVRAKAVAWIVAGLVLVGYFSFALLAYHEPWYIIGIAFGLLLVGPLMIAIIHDQNRRLRVAEKNFATAQKSEETK